MEIPQSQTKCSLYNSLSGATDYCTEYTLVLVFIGGPGRGMGGRVPPQKNFTDS